MEIHPQMKIDQPAKLQDFPYLSVKIHFRNYSKLGEKGFLGKFNSTNFFSLDANLTNQSGVSQNVPIYLLTKDKGALLSTTVFSTSINADVLLTKKLPFNPFDRSEPTISIVLDAKSQNDILEIVKYVNNKVGPLLSNPSSIISTSVPAVGIYGFLTGVIADVTSGSNKEIHQTIALG